jgi:hypothetical protein
MKILTTYKNIAEALNSWLGVLGVIVAGLYGLLEYIEHKQAVRVERSLAYVEKNRTGSTGEARLFLSQLLAKNQQSLLDILSQSGQTEAELSKAYNDFIVQMAKSAEAQRKLEISFSFYEEIAICVERELCDREVIMSFFGNDAKSLFNSFYPYVCSLRRQWNNNTVYLKTERFYVQTTTDICAFGQKI